MSELHPLVSDLALILAVAGVVTLIFKRLKQPLVLGYVVAGFLVSPHMPYIPNVVDNADIHTWADIGVMFLLFSLGLDFSFKKIMKMGISPFIAATVIIFSMMLLGYGVGHAFGWGQMDCIFLGGMLAMSSTTIIYKAFDDMGLKQQKFAGVVMSVLILEDILAIVMMVMLSAIASDQGADGGQMIMSIVRIGFFLVLWFVVGIFAIPLFLRQVRRLVNAEVLLIVSLGLCCGMAWLSTSVGFSSAFGAFVMGSILAETIEAERIERLVEPVKNLFGAVFFVSVGMLVDPAILTRYALPIAVLVLTILLGQSVLGTFGFMLSGQSLKAAMRCGFSMAQIGEFSFIIASLGLALGVISDFLYPVVVAVSVITTFLTPYMIRLALPAYDVLEHRLSRKWVKRLNRLTLSRNTTTAANDSLWRRLLVAMMRITLIYGVLTAAVIAIMRTIVRPLAHSIIDSSWVDVACAIATLAIVAPFLRAIVMKKNHSEEFKALWIENRWNRPMLILTIIVRMALVAFFIYIIGRGFLHISWALMLSATVILVVLIILSRGLKRRSIRMERLFIQNLRSRDIEAQVLGRRKPLYEGHLLDRDVHIGEVIIPEGSRWAGKTLRELKVGNRFGVHVSSILRGRRRLNIPGGRTVLFPGDRVQAIGNDSQLAAFNKAVTHELYADDPDIEKREMHLRQIIISQDSPLVGKTLQESGIRDTYKCMVVGLEEGEENLTPIDPTRLFQTGDIVWIVGEEENIRRITTQL
ncbi:MAG: cation:proton antiporter [Bacteroidaceae bacterium]|nr:cation:proton antiporter [Bacteroidaceae bacterium]